MLKKSTFERSHLHTLLPCPLRLTMQKPLASSRLLAPSYSWSCIYLSSHGLYVNHSSIRPMYTILSPSSVQVSKTNVLSRNYNPYLFFSPGCRICHSRRPGRFSVSRRKSQLDHRGWGTLWNWIFLAHILGVQPGFGSVRDPFFIYAVEVPYDVYLAFRRILLSDPTPPNNPILRITQNRRLFRIAILLGLILGIASSSSTNSNGSSSTTTDSLHVASTIIFLVVTILQAIQTFFLAAKHVSGMLSMKLSATKGMSADSNSFHCLRTRTKPVLHKRKRLHWCEIRKLHPCSNFTLIARSGGICDGDSQKQR